MLGKRIGRLGLTLLIASTAFAPSVSAAKADDVIVQGTTDIRDAGLLDDVIVPGFHQAYPQYNLKYIAVGTGQAITNARAGQGDALVTHAPTLEKTFVTDGYSLEPTGRAIFYSDYVIVGPMNDPAGVFSSAPHDAAAAFERIAAVGVGNNANFVSRGDNSGTNTQEKLIWQLTNVQLNNNHEPGDGTATGNPTWYHKAGTGQAQTVQLAAQCPFAGGGCYDMTDRGTFNRLVANGTITNLKVVADRNDPAARGGQNLLTNPFTAYAVNPNKASGVNVGGARAFLDYLASRAFQEQLNSYPSVTNPAFFPDARPEILLSKRKHSSKSAKNSQNLGRAIPKVAGDGKRLTVKGAVRNLLPGSPVLTGDPIVLQRAVRQKQGKRKVYERITKVRTKADGRFKVSFTARKNGKLRLLFPAVYPDLNLQPLLAVGSLQEQIIRLGSLRVRA